MIPWYKIQTYIKNPRLLALRILKKHFRKMDDETFIKFRFRASMGYNLDLSNPQTFNEKLQWLKLYDRNPDYVNLVDKIAVKEIVGKKIGEEHIIPNLGIYESEQDIDFAQLPEKFVIKCSHDSGSV